MIKGIALVTGACGGIGRACSRDLGRTHPLFLTDIDAVRLTAFAEALTEEGYTLAGQMAADLGVAGAAEQVVLAARAVGPVAAVAHAAGLSPTLGDWEAILQANVVATERLLLALETGLEEGLTAVLLASMAAHLAKPDPELDAICATPLDAGFSAGAKTRIEALAMPGMPFEPAVTAYTQSKRAVLLSCQRRCGPWGEKSARIVTVSPGTIWTPMGRKEADANPAAAAVMGMAPLKRWGRPSDIADAVAFLVSERASFITGADLRVDGGVTPVVLQAWNPAA